jgi:ADP-ribosylglycohydrolase
MRERATRGHLKPPPAAARATTVPLPLDLSPADFARLRIGSVPQEMEDKWLAFVEDETLHLHRSWTSFWFASVAFRREGAVYRATTARVNRDPEQYQGTSDTGDAATIRSLIARFIEENTTWVTARGRAPQLDARRLLARLFDQGQIRLERRADVLDREPEPLPKDFDFDRIEGMLLGLAIGDALGNTTEGQSPAERTRDHGEITGYLPNRYAQGGAVGLPSDDSQLAFWTLEQITADGGLWPEHLAHRFAGPRIFGMGETVRQFLRRINDEGVRWEEAGGPSAGNGALMRIAPVLVSHLRAPTPALWADAALAAMVTHNDPTSTAACVAFVRLLWDALHRSGPPRPGFWLHRFLEIARPLEGDTKLEPRFGPMRGQFKGSLADFTDRVVHEALHAQRPTREACDTWGSGAFLLETVPTVLYILERHSHSPREAILRAVNDTRDNDTVAAIVGAAVGARHGRKALPPEWIDGLLGRTGAHDDGRVFELIGEARERFWDL